MGELNQSLKKGTDRLITVKIDRSQIKTHEGSNGCSKEESSEKGVSHSKEESSDEGESHSKGEFPEKLKLKKSVIVELYFTMVEIREMELKIQEEYKNGNVRGFCHLSIGQESIYAALKQVLNESDKVIGSYRCHGLAYVTGLINNESGGNCSHDSDNRDHSDTIDSNIINDSNINDNTTNPIRIHSKEIIDENLGLPTGCSGGRGGSMHLYNSQFYGGHGIVGAQVPLGTGIAFALKYKRVPGVCFSFYGDGAANQGQVYESFNLAFIYKLPIVFVCENNHFGMYTPVSQVSMDDNFYKRGYLIRGIRVPDEDPFSLMAVLEHARNYALKEGPIILQIDTNRECGHSTKDEKQEYRNSARGAAGSNGRDILEIVRKRVCELTGEEIARKRS